MPYQKMRESSTRQMKNTIAPAGKNFSSVPGANPVMSSLTGTILENSSFNGVSIGDIFYPSKIPCGICRIADFTCLQGLISVMFSSDIYQVGEKIKLIFLIL